ncbi:RNA pseudouridine synthase [Pelagibaculum spongiae]|uniref:Dual-specificity RNA pseudouridine synthase RluA n=1 Tax=Pelagibaculum spongiae TaxID=2080658 RepID=A0A2V1GXQ7_9GAMM|nr:RNA pseudouridine synthase [Pelagibaculum spongiae]
MDVLYQDQHIVVIDKPAGVLSVPGRVLKDSVTSRLQQAGLDVLVVHRLDCATSGVMIFALDAASQKNLNRQFQDRVPTKYYQALIAGELSADDGLVDLPLICDWPNRPLQKVCYEHGKPSQTIWQKLESFQLQQNLINRILLKPITGRSHQLRVHMKALGHPILGDAFYATDSVKALSERLCLHAWKLKLKHPLTENWIEFEANLPF